MMSPPATTTIVRKTSNVPERMKLTDLDPSPLTCPLCQGYLIDSTTINECMHSFCRSCIVKHLNSNKYCPCCKTKKEIQLSNLRTDNQLKSIVYKLISGLYQSENQRIEKFYKEQHKLLTEDDGGHLRNNASHFHKAAFKPLVQHNTKQTNNSNKNNNNNNNNNSNTNSNQSLNSQQQQQQQQQQQHHQIDLCERDSSSSSTCRQTRKEGINNDAASSGKDNKIIDDVDDDDNNDVENVEFYAPDDPISLSLEYYPKSVTGCDKSLVPPIRYLQCPAAVTVHHLRKFLSSKFNLNIDTDNVDINIIYGDDVLPVVFSLMDIAYSYEYKRIKPMQIFYQILISTAVEPTPEDDSSHQEQQPLSPSSQTNISDVSTNSFNTPINSKKQQQQQQQQQQNYKNNKQDQQQQQKQHQQVDNNKIENNDSKIFKYSLAKPNNNISKSNNQVNNNNRYSISIQKPVKPTKVTFIKNNKQSSDNNDNSTKTSPNKIQSDFKSLRSNNYVAPAAASDPIETITKVNTNKNVVPPSDFLIRQSNSKSKTMPTAASLCESQNKSSSIALQTKKQQQLQQPQQQQHQQDEKNAEEVKLNKKNKDSKNLQKNGGSINTLSSSVTAIEKNPNIIVSIPKSRQSSLTDDQFDNLSLSSLKTANKKSKTSAYKQSVSLDESSLNKYTEDGVKRDIPKLKITVPKSVKFNNASSNGSSSSSSSTSSKSMSRDQSPTYNQSQVDLREYAKNIGLKPVEDNATKYENDGDRSSSSSHKKRKKSNKHSREPGSSKRRKLHAEISSQEEESLKLKVKITANKPSKHERKNSSTSSSDDGVLGKKEQSAAKDNEGDKVRVPTPPIKASPKVCRSMSIDVDSVFISSAESQPTVPLPIMTATSTAGTNVTPSFTFIKPKPSEKPKHILPKPIFQNMKATNDVRPIQQRMFSPPHIPNYPSFQFKKITPDPAGKKFAPKLSPIIHQNVEKIIPMAILKRSASVDGSPFPVKQQKLETLPRKSIPNLIPTSAAAKALAKPQHTQTKPTESYYNSSMSSTYTREITTKKPMPILLPPSSISVTKMTDVPKLAPTSTVTRPALEIVRISSTVPAVDQQHQKLNSITQTKPIMVSTQFNGSQQQQHHQMRQHQLQLQLQRQQQQQQHQQQLHQQQQQQIQHQQQQQQKLHQQHQQQQLQKQQQLHQMQFQKQQAEQKQTQLKQNQAVSNNRPPPQTIPLVKIKKAANNQATGLSAIQNSFQKTNGNKTPKLTVSLEKSNESHKYNPVCDNIGALDLSSRSPTHETALSPTDSSKSSTPPLTAQSKPQPTITTIIDITDEAITLPQKQQPSSLNKSNLTTTESNNNHSKNFGSMPKTSTTDTTTKTNDSNVTTKTTASKTISNANINKLTSEAMTKIFPQNTATWTNSSGNKIKNSNAKDVDKTDATNASSADANLKMLSDSALNREKLPTTMALTVSTNSANRISMPKLNEINKIRSPTVRQQNASVRNVPNPSALAFRNQNVSQTQTSVTTTTTAASTSTKAVPVTMTSNNNLLSSSSSSSSTMSSSSVTSSSATKPSISKATNSGTTMTTTKTSPTMTSKATSNNNVSINNSCNKQTVVATTTTTKSLTPTSQSAQSLQQTSSNSSGNGIATTTTTTTTSSTSSTTTTTASATSITTLNSDNNDAKLIAAKKNLHIEKVAATLRAAAASESTSHSSSSTITATTTVSLTSSAASSASPSCTIPAAV